MSLKSKDQVDLIEDITVEELLADGLVEDVEVSGEETSKKKDDKAGAEATDAVKANADTKASIDQSASQEADKEDHVGQGPGTVETPDEVNKAKAATDAAIAAAPVAEPPKTKAGLINAVYQQLVSMKTEDVANVYSTLANPAVPPKAQEPAPMQTGDDSTNKDQRKEATEEDDAEAGKTPETSTPGQPEAEEPGEKEPAEDDEDDSEDDKEDDDKDMKESLNVLFSAEKSLTEGFRTKASALFESAVKAKVAAEVNTIEENYENQLNEEIATVTKTLSEKVDSYLDYVVQTWMEENKVAVEAGLRTEIAENFIGALKNVFKESYIEVPEAKENLVDSLNREVSKLEEQLLKATESNMTLAESVTALQRAQVIAEVSDDLASTETVKLNSLVEDVDFEDAKTFSKKVQSIKETYFRKPVSKSTPTAVETAITESNEAEVELSPLMAAVSAAISRTSKF